jgi:hypothetical protein
MSSKKLPLWLVFDADGTDLYVIYKSGDDLRQDEMTLQMVRRFCALSFTVNLDPSLVSLDLTNAPCAP